MKMHDFERRRDVHFSKLFMSRHLLPGDEDERVGWMRMKEKVFGKIFMEKGMKRKEKGAFR